MKRLVLFLLACAIGLTVAAAATGRDAVPLAATPSAAKPDKACRSFSGPVRLVYSNPQTIVLHVIKGKVNAATPFTMTATTTYTRNGAPARFGDIRLGDDATICAVEQLPSGVLLASWVRATGP